MINIQTIDWNQAWKEKKAMRSYPFRGRSSWNKRAPSFAENSVRSNYAEAFIRIIDPKQSWRIFDMACGTGTLAVPLAKHVRNITAADFSDTMLDILRTKCERSNISNIRMMNVSWEDDWNKAGIGIHDIVIASRSLVVDDLRGAIEKLDSFARRQVYISTIVGDGPHDRRVFDAIGRELDAGPDYIYTYNLLYQMGINANIAFIVEKNRRSYKTPHDAFQSMQWMIGDMNTDEETKLENYLDKHLVYSAGWWTLDYETTVKWAVIWWGK